MPFVWWVLKIYKVLSKSHFTVILMSTMYIGQAWAPFYCWGNRLRGKNVSYQLWYRVLVFPAFSPPGDFIIELGKKILLEFIGNIIIYRINYVKKSFCRYWKWAKKKLKYLKVSCQKREKGESNWHLILILHRRLWKLKVRYFAT